MPKNKPMAKMLRTKRSEKRQQLSKNPAGFAYFSVIGCGAKGASNSLLLSTDCNYYMFNCGEATQRSSNEYISRAALGMVGNIFITRRSWKNLGGLLGTCLTIRSTGSPDVTIHGPEGCMLIYESTKQFIVMHDFSMMAYDQNRQGVFEDGAVSIRNIPLNPELDEAIVPSKPIYGMWKPAKSVSYLRPEENNLNVFVDTNCKVNLRPVSQEVYAYVVNVKSKPGKLDIKKCVELCVPPGPILGSLKAGNDVTLDDGTVIKSVDVVEPSEKPLVYIVIECPTVAYLNALKSEARLQPDHEDMEDIKAVFHFTPVDVVNSEGYSEWINSFPAHTKHVMMNGASNCYMSYPMANFNKQLNSVSPDLFPKLHFTDENNKMAYTEAAKVYANIRSAENIIQGKNGLKLLARPTINVVQDLSENPASDKYVNDEAIDPEDSALVKEQVDATRNHIDTLMASKDQGLEYPKVTFLGTGSSIPSRYRNVSCILVETEKDKFFVLDCGEGSCLQLHRMFGVERAQEILRNTKAVYISHLHADHHLGLISLTQGRVEAFQAIGKEVEQIYVIAPSRISNYLLTYHQTFEDILDSLHLIRNEHLLHLSISGSQRKAQFLYDDIKVPMLDAMGMESIDVVRANHCPASFCLSFITKSAYKIVYSGDTRPVNQLIELGKMYQQTDLLIHEATMEHYMLEDAKVKRHTTFTEAIEQGSKMEAGFTMLTHFSARYHKVPTFDELEGEADYFKKTGIAFDCMTVNPRTFDLVRHTYPAMKAIFKKELASLASRRDDFGSKTYTEYMADNVIAKETEPAPPKKAKIVNDEALYNKLINKL